MRRRTKRALRRSAYVALGVAYLVGSGFAVVKLSPPSDERTSELTQCVRCPSTLGHVPSTDDPAWTLTDV